MWHTEAGPSWCLGEGDAERRVRESYRCWVDGRARDCLGVTVSTERRPGTRVQEDGCWW